MPPVAWANIPMQSAPATTQVSSMVAFGDNPDRGWGQFNRKPPGAREATAVRPHPGPDLR
jgi:hypothetical protein